MKTKNIFILFAVFAIHIFAGGMRADSESVQLLYGDRRSRHEQDVHFRADRCAHFIF